MFGLKTRTSAFLVGEDSITRNYYYTAEVSKFFR